MSLLVFDLNTEKITCVKNIDVNAKDLPEKIKQLHPDDQTAADGTVHGLSYSQVERLFLNLKALAEDSRFMLTMMPLNPSPNSWDSQYNPFLKITDLDADSIFKAVDQGLHESRLPDQLYKEQYPAKLLQAIGLMDEHGLKNAAQVLFARRGAFRPHECILNLAAYSGDDKTVLVASSRLSGGLFDMLEAGTDFCLQHMPLKEGRSERNENNLILPLRMVHEALLNALCHRDYKNPSGSVCLNIYRDHLVVENNGTLPDGWSTFKLYDVHPSVPFNPLTAHVLYLTGHLSTLGRGFTWIVSQCSTMGLLPPMLDVHNGWVKLTLRYPDNTKIKISSLSVISSDSSSISQDMPTVSYKVAQLVSKLGYGLVSAKQLRTLLGLKGHDNFVRSYLNPALEAHLIELEFPETPRHPQQRYRLSDAGRRFYEENKQNQ